MIRIVLTMLVAALAVSCQSTPPPTCSLSVVDAVQYCQEKCAARGGLLTDVLFMPPFVKTECACVRPNLAPPSPRLTL